MIISLAQLLPPLYIAQLHFHDQTSPERSLHQAAGQNQSSAFSSSIVSNLFFQRSPLPPVLPLQNYFQKIQPQARHQMSPLNAFTVSRSFTIRYPLLQRVMPLQGAQMYQQVRRLR